MFVRLNIDRNRLIIAFEILQSANHNLLFKYQPMWYGNAESNEKLKGMSKTVLLLVRIQEFEKDVIFINDFTKIEIEICLRKIANFQIIIFMHGKANQK